MNSFRAYQLYLAVKFHFSQPKYDFFKYDGKVSAKPESFKKRKDVFAFQRLSKLYNEKDYVGFLVSNIVVNPKMYSRDLVQPEAEQVYHQWLKRVEGLAYHFEQTSKNLWNQVPEESTFVEEFLDPSNPGLLQEYVDSNVSLEYITVFNRISGFLDKASQSVLDNPFYENLIRQIGKYQSFLDIDLSKYRKIFHRIYQDSGKKFDK